MNKEHDFCLRCGRKLKNPRARQIGYGIICEKKMKYEKSHQLFDTNGKEEKEKLS